MKKTYQIPAVTIAEIELQHMIAASDQITLSDTEYDGTAVIESRRNGGGLWDEEDEEY